MRALLKVGDDSVHAERKNLYFSRGRAKLSEFIGKSECQEQAVVGKLLLDKFGINSSLIGGVHVDSAEDYPNNSAFLLLDDPQTEGSLVFDIARPKRSFSGYPRILRTDKKITYSTFEGKDNYVVAVDIYDGSTLYYGVGNSWSLEDVNIADSIPPVKNDK